MNDMTQCSNRKTYGIHQPQATSEAQTICHEKHITELTAGHPKVASEYINIIHNAAASMKAINKSFMSAVIRYQTFV